MNYDVLVIGGGHAGCEAACASANMGAKTCLVTMDMNKIAQMSCNPAVGGIAKGQIVREIDALGGQMGLVTDATAIQFRMLNRSKGPAMWSPRAQCDRGKFIWEWRRVLDHTDNLDIWQDQADELLVESVTAAQQQTKQVVGVKTIWGVELRAKAVIVTAGTFLNGLMHIGRKMVPGGRIAEPAVPHFTESITRHGVRSERMKTGTPVRIDKRSIHFEDLEIQEGEHDFHQFSYMSEARPLPQLTCWTCNTNTKVHETLRSGLNDSPLYNGQIQSIGPRYCPSIETKLVTFPDREQHPLFLEPEGTDTNELYLNGFSSSLPMDVQIAALRHIPAFRDLKVYRPGYAIEYDFFDPTQLHHTLETKQIKDLFFAGQINGTTGYEEAAGQGLVAGVNAHINVHGGAPFTMGRDESYIGVLIDDLVNKGVDEPYRMFTSRAEYRILLRQDNADERLTKRSYEMGLADRYRYELFCKKQADCAGFIDFLQSSTIRKGSIDAWLESIGSSALHEGTKMSDLILRPQVSIQALAQVVPELKQRMEDLSDEVIESCEIQIKYAGYIKREQLEAAKLQRLDQIRIPDNFSFDEVQSLSTEARQKLSRIRPKSIGEAQRIPGVSPNDVSVLLVLMGR